MDQPPLSWSSQGRTRPWTPRPAPFTCEKQKSCAQNGDLDPKSCSWGVAETNGRVTVFDLTAADAGVAAFEPGRFGFYNFSQPDVTYSNFSAAPAKAQPPPSPFPATGLLHHLDAAKGVTLEGNAVQSWKSGAAVLAAPGSDQRPTLLPDAVNGAPVIRFDGVDDVLESLGNGTSVDGLTVLAVVAPKANEGDFAAIVSATDDRREDLNAGFTVDLGGSTWDGGACASSYPDALDAFNTINLQSAKKPNACGKDFFGGSLPFGEFHLLTVEAGHVRLDLRLDGQAAGFFDYGRSALPISLDVFRVGARFHQTTLQGFFDGDVAEVVVYGRVLSLGERDRLEAQLRAKYGL